MAGEAEAPEILSERCPGVTVEGLLARPLPVSWAKQRQLILGAFNA